MCGSCFGSALQAGTGCMAEPREPELHTRQMSLEPHIAAEPVRSQSLVAGEARTLPAAVVARAEAVAVAVQH
jgi:hypothetical protein